MNENVKTHNKRQFQRFQRCADTPSGPAANLDGLSFPFIVADRLED